MKSSPFDPAGLDISDLLKERSKIPKPILSEEQVQDIENVIKESYANKTKIEISIYKDRFINKSSGVMERIKQDCIILDNKKKLYFVSIVDVKAI